MRRLENKVVILTASTKGLGLSMARRMSQEGAMVVVSSRRQHHVDAAVRELRSAGCEVTGVVCHVANPAHRKRLIDTAVETYGGIDVLVSNAAVNPSFGPILDTSEDAWDKIFEVNVKAAFFLAKEVVPHLKKRSGGNIIFISSIAAYNAAETAGAYAVSKTALVGLTTAMALQCATMNIRVNCVCPGIFKTDFAKVIIETPAMANRFIDNSIIMKRFGDVDEIGGVVAFLASDDASYMTGESVVVAGGMFSRL